MTVHTYYDILGVPPDATEKIIRKAYLRASRHLHPDMNGGVEKPEYLDVQEAYNTLRSPVERRTYDESLRNHDVPPVAGYKPEPAEPDPGWGVSVTAAKHPTVDHVPTPDGDAKYVHPRPFPRHSGVVGVVAVVAGSALTGVAVAQTGWWAMAVALAFALAFVVLGGRFLAVLSTVAVAAVAAVSPSPALMGLPAVVGVLGAVVFRLHRRREKGTPDSVGHEPASEFFQWGKPGGIAGNIGLYTGTGRKTSRAQQSTATSLAAALSDIPGVRVLHSVRVPGRPGDVVDHLVVCGTKVAVLESVLWPGEEYCWSPDGGVVRGSTFSPAARPYRTTLPADVAAFAGVAHRIRTAGWLIVHPASKPVLLWTSNLGAPAHVAMGEPDQVMAALRAWLVTDNDPRVVDLRLLRSLIDMVEQV